MLPRLRVVRGIVASPKKRRTAGSCQTGSRKEGVGGKSALPVVDTRLGLALQQPHLYPLLCMHAAIAEVRSI